MIPELHHVWSFILLLFALVNQDSKAVVLCSDMYPNGFLPFDYISDAKFYHFVLANPDHRASINKYSTDQEKAHQSYLISDPSDMIYCRH